jgi:cation/acetate symporter
LYTVCPAVGAFARLNLIKNTQNIEYAAWTQQCSADQAAALAAAHDNPAVDAARADCAGQWFQTWENSGLLAWMDKNGDGKI